MQEYLTVKDLKDILSDYDDDLIICTSHDSSGDDFIVTREQIYPVDSPYFGNCGIGMRLLTSQDHLDDEDEEFDATVISLKFLNIGSS